MFAKLHLLSQDVPEGGDGFRWRAHPYLRMAGTVPKGPVVFDWSARQRADLEALWRDPASEGARERLAKDLAAFCDKLGWTPDAKLLADAEEHGDEYMLTLSSVPPELYVLPWEVIQVGAAGTYLSDYVSAQVRYAMPGLGPREIQTAPPVPGVLFAWSSAGGAVPHEEQAAAIRAAAEAGGATFRELADVDDGSLQAALDAGPPSVLHLLCHGLSGPEGEPSRLSWGTSDRPSEITATRLARMLRHHDDAIRLVVLSACGSGDGRGDPLFMSSLAQELHKKGIPNVVASRYPLSVRGSCVMTRALYDRLLREAWSLERALRHTRAELFRVDEDGEAHPGDAYGIQLYAYDTEWFVSDNDVQAERPVLASYPFGTAARPVPATAPPAAELTLQMDADPGLSEEELVDRLRRVSEDDRLMVMIRSLVDRGAVSVIVHTTVDGSQRLLGAWRSKSLQVALGVIVGAVILTKGIGVALGSTLSAASGKVTVAAEHAAASGKVTVAAGHAVATAGKAVATKLAIAALLGGMAAVGAVMVHASPPQQPQPSAPPQLALLEGARPAALPGVMPAAWPSPPTPWAFSSIPSASPIGPVLASDEHRAPRPNPHSDESAGARAGSGAPSAGARAGSGAPSAGARAGSGAPAAASGCTGNCGEPRPVCGDGIVEAGEQCDDGNTDGGDGCSSSCLTEPEPRPRMLPSSIDSSARQRLSISDNGHRISGETQIFPTKGTRKRMIDKGVTSVQGTVGLCVAATGSVKEAKMMESTGYGDYDKELLAAVRGWTYPPTPAEDTSGPVCSEVEFTYTLE